MKYYSFVRHVSEDALEAYVLGRLPELGVASLEEHLFICDACQQRLRALDEFIEMLRVATGGGSHRSSSASG